MSNEVNKYIDKQKLPQRKICQKLRRIILKVLPNAKEEMKWGAVVYDNGRYYIGVVKYGVNMGFAVKGLNKDEISLFEGSGKTMRHIKIFDLKSIDEPRLKKLIKLVYNKAKCVECLKIN